MSAVEVVGWVATVSGTILGLPQVLRLVRTGRVEGLSLTAWQAMLVVNVGWTAHGIGIGQVPQILTSILSLCSTVPILYLMARELQRHLLPVLLPGLLAAGALIAIDQVLGSAAYGTMAIIPAVISNAGQSIELVRARRIVGVSVLFLILAVVNQGLWLSWAVLVPDIGTVITATVTGIITLFNLIWWSLRILGLRPLLAAGAAHRGLGSPTYGQSQHSSSRTRAAVMDHRYGRVLSRSADPAPVQRRLAERAKDAGKLRAVGRDRRQDSNLRSPVGERSSALAATPHGRR